MYSFTCVHEGVLDCACMCAKESVWISEDNLQESILFFQDMWGLAGGVKLRFSALASAHSCETSVLEDSMPSLGICEPQACTGQYANT